MRFANSDTNINSDFKADVHALSFAVELAPPGVDVAGTKIVRQDYSVQNAATLPINDAHAFLAMMKVLTASSHAKAAWLLPWRDKLGFARTMALAQLQAHQAIEPYQQARYWSTVPFCHGPVDVVKYSARPCTDNPAGALLKSDPKSLQDELVRHLEEDDKMSCFNFGLQFLDTGRVTYWSKRRGWQLLLD